MEAEKEKLLVEDVHKVKNDMATLKIQMGEIVAMKAQVNEIFIAFKGSEIMKDGGLVSRIINNEKEIELCSERTKLAYDRLETKILELEKKENNQALKIAIMWAMGGGFIVLLFNLLFHSFFKK